MNSKNFESNYDIQVILLLNSGPLVTYHKSYAILGIYH